jgi:16S rRNA (uracil1498-N3)-methyltransferase
VLSPDRSHYICRVLRHATGDEILCFDGCGREVTCRITKQSTSACEIEVLQETQHHRPVKPRLHIALALLKGQPMDRAIQQATELGATDIWLLQTVRSNVQLNESRLGNKLEHWQKILGSSTEQCGSVFVPTLHSLASISDTLNQAGAQPMAFHPEGKALPTSLDSCDRLLFIGPEGGWDDGEIALFNQLSVPCYRLGNLTFRAETAPSVTLALIQQAQGWSAS